ncbi:hypothetical protein ACOME3_003019 [Neoechinorhynchus agilis]
MLFLLLVLLALFTTSVGFEPGSVVYAINCGGSEFTDSYGIVYKADDLSVGTVSVHGQSMAISRVPHPSDQKLYQTERYHSSSFTYDLPLSRGDGNYILWLKFSEVWFTSSLQKVFNVVLNHNVRIINDLDIYSLVGKAAAHDEYVEFQIENNGHTLVYKGTKSHLKKPGVISVTFEKTDYDNPKVNAIILLKNSKFEDIPPLLPIESYAEEEDDEYNEDDDILTHFDQSIKENKLKEIKTKQKFKIIGEDDDDDLENDEPEEARNQLGLPIICAITVVLISVALIVQRI